VGDDGVMEYWSNVNWNEGFLSLNENEFSKRGYLHRGHTAYQMLSQHK
jgi:hypothetical protein